MGRNVTIIGGDLRLVKLSQILANEDKVFTYGLEKTEEFENIKKCENMSEAIGRGDFVVSAVPLSKDNTTVAAPFSNKDIYITEVIENIDNKLFMAGKINNNIFKNINYIDLLEREELAVFNSISTAEGAIQIAMEETLTTIHGSNILVLGFGRIGKILAKMLQGIGANVYCEARKHSDIAWIKSYGYNAINIEQLNTYLHKFDIIINTIPNIVLNSERIDLLKKDCIIIDLASAPGGVDFEYAKKHGVKTICALALPGKVAPITSAKYIKETIDNILKEKEF